MMNLLRYENKLLSYYPDNIPPKEIWVEITDNVVKNIISNSYFINNYGYIYSKLSNMLMKPILDKDGYCKVGLFRCDKSVKQMRIHRLVMLTFCYNPNYKFLQVNHIDGNKLNNRLDNLEWCTDKENKDHAIKNNLYNPRTGEDCSFATITNLQAEEIAKLLYLEKYSHKEIAEIVGIDNVSIVRAISAGCNWKEYYNKYKLYMRKRTQYERQQRFSDKEIGIICQYFQDHKDDNFKRKILFSNALALINVEYSESLRKTMEKVLKKTGFQHITLKYDY